MEQLETLTGEYETPEQCFGSLHRLCAGRQVYSVYLSWDEDDEHYDLIVVLKGLTEQEQLPGHDG